jgi:SAM-dependent methyltransferase
VIERRTVTTRAELRAAYDEIYARTAFGAEGGLYRRVLRVLRAPAGETILDVGCGAGPFLAAALAAGYGAIGVDLSGRALERARRAAPGARLLQGAGEALPLATAGVAYAVCLGNLEHFLDPAAGARELGRVVRPGGRIAVLLPNAYYSGDIWRVIRHGRGPDHHQAIDRFAPLEEWRDLLAGAGLTVESVGRYDKGKWWKRLLPFNLAYHFLFLCRPGGA